MHGRWNLLGVIAVLLLSAGASPAAAQGAVLRVPGADSAAAATEPDERYRRREAERLRRRREFEGAARGRRQGEGGRDDAPPLPDAAGSFLVRVETDAPEYVVDGEGQGEALWIRVTAERDGYLTLLSGGAGPGFTVLAPNGLVAELPIRAGEPLRFPLVDWVRRGLELVPRLPPGVEESQQAIIAVVTDRPVALPIDPFAYDPAAPEVVLSRPLFQQWLSRIPASRRGVGQVLYLVRRG